VGTATLPCDDANPCTHDVCDPLIGCVNPVASGAACEDGDPCTLDDRCDAAGACVAGRQATCTPPDACSAGHCDPVQGCVFSPLDGESCVDDDPCTTSMCQGGACVVIGTVVGCCHDYGDCADPWQLCDAVQKTCVPASCHACVTDDDCGGAGSRCLALPSGSYCGVDCAPGTGPCPDDTLCHAVGPEQWQCLPVQGDCACVLTDTVACVGGDLVAVDSCGSPGDVVFDCGGRGCAGVDCCVAGTHEVGSACEPDAVEPAPDAVELDATGPDATETWPLEVAPESVDAAAEASPEVDSGSVADESADPDGPGAEAGAEALGDHLTSSDPGHDAQGDADLRADSSNAGPDAGTGSGRGGGCVVPSRYPASPFGGIAALLLSFGLLASRRRARTA
jgi:hypothetical protein